MIGAQPLQCAVQVGVHVGVIGMTFINNDNFSSQTQVPKHNMLLTKRCHKKLIHCAYNQVCQELCFSSSEEGVYNQRFRYHIISFLCIAPVLLLHLYPLQPLKRVLHTALESTIKNLIGMSRCPLSSRGFCPYNTCCFC